MVFFSSTCGTGSTLSSSRFLMTVLSPVSLSFLMTVVSSALTVADMGAVTITAATVARMSLRIGRFSFVRFVTQNNAHLDRRFQHLRGTTPAANFLRNRRNLKRDGGREEARAR